MSMVGLYGDEPLTCPFSAWTGQLPALNMPVTRYPPKLRPYSPELRQKEIVKSVWQF